MSVKRKSYSADFKAKLVLEVLEGEKTVNEIASRYEVLPVSLKSWKKQFLENMSLAFDKSIMNPIFQTSKTTFLIPPHYAPICNRLSPLNLKLLIYSK
jgi:putative transposase